MAVCTTPATLKAHLSHLYNTGDDRVYEEPSKLDIVHIGTASNPDHPVVDEEIYVFAVDWSPDIRERMNVLYVFRIYPEQGDVGHDNVGLIYIREFVELDGVVLRGRLQEAFSSRIQFGYY